MRIHPAVSTKADFNAQLNRLCKAFALDISSLAIFAQILLGPALFGADIVDIVAIIDVHDQPDACVLGHLQGFIIDQAGMFD